MTAPEVIVVERAGDIDVIEIDGVTVVEVVLDDIGPPGPAGPTGPAGPAGAQGPAGDPSAAQTIVTNAATAYTLLATDAGKFIRFTGAGGCTVTLPTGTVFAAGQRCDLVGASGPVTFALGSGANWSMTMTPPVVSKGVGAVVTAIKMGSSTWHAFGMM